MRVVVADPPAFTPPYDHELAAALARAGADVELVTSHFRFGAAPEPEGYSRREPFYPLSSRLFRRSPLRLPLKALEHPLGLAVLAALNPDVVHLQWLAWPQLDARLLRLRAPSGGNRHLVANMHAIDEKHFSFGADLGFNVGHQIIFAGNFARFQRAG